MIQFIPFLSLIFIVLAPILGILPILRRIDKIRSLERNYL